MSEEEREPPWRQISETVRAVIAGGRIHIEHGGQQVAVHPECAGRRQRLIEPAHFNGMSPVSMLPRPRRGRRRGRWRYFGRCWSTSS